MPMPLGFFQMMTLCWPWPFLWQGQICFLMLRYGWQLIKHWVLMYFQVCSNSAYPQHSSEWYRTNGPLVLILMIEVILFPFKANSEDPDQPRILRRLIRVCTVCSRVPGDARHKWVKYVKKPPKNCSNYPKFCGVWSGSALFAQSPRGR